MIRFNLRGEYIELNKLLKAAGVCESGGAANQAIAAGLVKVDGQTETRKGGKIRAGRQVEFDGKVIQIEESGV